MTPNQGFSPEQVKWSCHLLKWEAYEKGRQAREGLEFSF